jgi:hypothetical protein
MCTAPSTGYYYIFLSVSETIMPLFPRVLVNYQSDNYLCPTSSSYKDENQLFPNCVQIVTNAAYPCINYDYSSNACTQCQSSFVLEAGSCYMSVDCGLEMYFHQGNCYPAPNNCQNFKQIGGDCTQCVDGYVLVSTAQGKSCSLSSQSTNTPSNLQTQKSPTISQTIPNNSYNAASNQTASGSNVAMINATTNQPTTYTPSSPSNYTPTRPVKTITCDSGTYLSNGLCVYYPPHCS